MLNVINNINIEANAIVLAPIPESKLDPNKENTANYFYDRSKIHSKYEEILIKLEGLLKEFNADSIKDIFYDFALIDQDLYLDIIIAISILTRNKDDISRNEYSAIMYDAVAEPEEIAIDEYTEKYDNEKISEEHEKIEDSEIENPDKDKDVK